MLLPAFLPLALILSFADWLRLVLPSLEADFHSAIYNKNYARAERLLDEGANLNADIGGETPLHMAARKNDTQSLEWLIQRGARLDPPDKKTGSTPLVWAVLKNANDAIQSLLAHGANANALNYRGISALEIAMSEYQIKIMELLLEHGADSNAGRGDLTPMLFAIGKRQPELAALLLKHGANVRDVDADKLTPLHRAAHTNQTNIAEMLIAGGANLNAADCDGWTPLHWAASTDSAAAVKMLLGHGAFATARTNDNNTPLHLAAHKHSLASTQLLIDHLTQDGGDINIKGYAGWTPLHWAARANAVKIAQLLIQHGADIDAIANNDITPLEMARRMQHSDMVAYLESLQS